MEVDIWSDIRCPFCYIGKRRFENALGQFEQKDNVKIVWHSFQLDPSTKYQPGKDIYNYLAERKGQTREWSLQVHRQVTEMARQAGLEYNFDKVINANSFDAHRLIQLAKGHNLGDAAEERLFKAYFTEGKNISDKATLLALGIETGLDRKDIETLLDSNAYTEEVHQDESIAQSIGVRGVPFFVVNDRYAISGAQSSETFLQTLQKAWKEHEQETNPSLVEGNEEAACDTDGNC